MINTNDNLRHPFYGQFRILLDRAPNAVVRDEKGEFCSLQVVTDRHLLSTIVGPMGYIPDVLRLRTIFDLVDRCPHRVATAERLHLSIIAPCMSMQAIVRLSTLCGKPVYETIATEAVLPPDLISDVMPNTPLYLFWESLTPLAAFLINHKRGVPCMAAVRNATGLEQPINPRLVAAYKQAKLYAGFMTKLVEIFEYECLS